MRGKVAGPLIAAGVLALVALASAVLGPVQVGEPNLPLAGLRPGPSGGDQPGAAADEVPADPADASGLVAVRLLLVLAAVILVVLVARMLLRHWTRRELPGPARHHDGTELTEALRVAAGTAARDAEAARPGRAGNAVVACWVRLEEAAASAGTPRSAPDTPTEFTASLLRAHDADRDAVEALLRLYHRARFGQGRLPDEAATEAAEALRRIATSLSAGTGTAP